MYSFSGRDLICNVFKPHKGNQACRFFVVIIYSKEITQYNDSYQQTEQKKGKITF